MPRKKARKPNTSASQTTPESSAEAASPAAVPASVPSTQSKISKVLDLLRRKQGATLVELVEATGWLPHTTRAALTGLKKKGHVIEKMMRENVTCYRIAGEAV